MDENELDDFVLNMHQQFFHVLSDDIDSQTGAKLEEVMLVQMLAACPGALKHKPLKQWVDENIGRNFLADIKRENEKTLNKQRKKVMTYEEKENWKSVWQRTQQEGFHYCFEHYSNWEEIKDEEFHKLRNEYLKSAKTLEEYIKNKVETDVEEDLPF